MAEEENPYAKMTLEELEAVNWKEFSLDWLRMFEAAVRDLAKVDLSAFVLWLAVRSRLSELEVKARCPQ